MSDEPEHKSEFNRDMEFIFKEIQGSTAWSMDRNRPYDGQQHTDCGERGKTIVKGLTIRDIGDCIVKGILAAGGVERENPVYDDVYKVDLTKIDPLAVVKNASCEIEKMMGIFPNVPPLKFLDEKDGKYKTWEEKYAKDGGEK